LLANGLATKAELEPNEYVLLRVAIGKRIMYIERKLSEKFEFHCASVTQSAYPETGRPK
jgi:hypothetical protein